MCFQLNLVFTFIIASCSVSATLNVNIHKSCRVTSVNCTQPVHVYYKHLFCDAITWKETKKTQPLRRNPLLLLFRRCFFEINVNFECADYCFKCSPCNIHEAISFLSLYFCILWRSTCLGEARGNEDEVRTLAPPWLIQKSKRHKSRTFSQLSIMQSILLCVMHDRMQHQDILQ